MDSIAFDIVEANVNDEPGGAHRLGIRIRINGHPLIDMVRELERPMALQEEAPSIAGAYTWLDDDAATQDPSRYFHGLPAMADDEQDGHTSLLSCGECGLTACWPLRCRIEVREDRVVWRDFANPYRDPNRAKGGWSYTGFGPFEFERQAYERALLSLTAKR
jgi:hypothetical protein